MWSCGVRFLKASSFRYECAETKKNAFDLLAAEENAIPIAGGQSLIILMRLRLAVPALVVDITRVTALTKSMRTSSGCRIGAATSHAQIEDVIVPDVTQGLMPFAASGIAYRAVRNIGTIGGSISLADLSADWPVCLLALNAGVVLESASGERTVPIDDFLVSEFTTRLAPGEIVTAVDIPTLPVGTRWGYVKLARKQGAFADSLCAAIFPPEGGKPRVALGAAAARASFMTQTMALLEQSPGAGSLQLRDAVEQDVVTLSAVADSYRKRCHVSTVLKAIQQARGAQCAPN